MSINSPMTDEVDGYVKTPKITHRATISAPVGAGKGKVQFSVGEEEMIAVFEKMGLTHLEAVDQCIKYKYEQVFYYRQLGTPGGEQMAQQLLKELGEDV